MTVSYPNSTAYEQIEASFFSIAESSLTPTCIVSPNTTSQVVEALTVLYGCNTDFAIKSNGHGPGAGLANIDGGITIDVTGLASVTLSADQKVVTAGSGANWFDVYAALDPYNLVAAGGRNGLVGVGGLTLGGGISYWGPQVGFTCDTVVNFELVLANGSLVDANATHNSDLFRALKGGTNNFGLLTSVSLNTISSGEIYAGALAQNFTLYHSDVFKAFAGIADPPNGGSYDVHASIVTGMNYNTTSKAWSISSNVIYTLPVDRPAVYEPLFSIPNISDTRAAVRLAPFSNENPTPPLYVLFETATYGVSADLMEDMYNIVNSTLDGLAVPGPWTLFSVTFEPLPAIFVSHGAGKNVLGTTPEEGNAMIILFTVVYLDASSSDTVNAATKEMMGLFDEAAKKRGLFKPYRYANYANTDQAVIESYGEKNVEFLRQVSRKYDPHGVFQKRVPGGFKVLAP